jgi:hypothetical protein
LKFENKTDHITGLKQHQHFYVKLVHYSEACFLEDEQAGYSEEDLSENKDQGGCID